MRKATLGGFLGPVIFLVVVIVAALMRPGYSHVVQFISELGATGSENAALMNYAGFVLSGLLIVSFGVALLSILPSQLATIAGSVLVCLFGLGVTASGLISCDLGCPQDSGTTANLVHNTIAPIAFVCLIAASLVFGVSWWRKPGLRSLAMYSLGSGAIALVLLAMLASSLEARELTGLWQRLLLVVLFSWCAIVALKIARLEDKRL